ncbi:MULTISPECIES: hypothetical protein [Microbacterium]|uniref:Sugar ABC transporter ATPase n=1 Tax=Microbacterium wangchenii TaxID=2541726 RepID=A0ABX5SUL0_9MICO|nr:MULTISPECIES: hypothetical protein [Microbacterium]MCK6067161.1 hypothetical protein [Microbacterium sp. EYE_512]QBR89883.1 hypothetical protein E4K62_15040 [Microbacterium wangchenii]TFV85259.1 hypothetical protein E4V99_09690 [Microbacterium sp. dk485]TXK16520.1 hypothetical protein FVP99_07475 [Microbacterium wangchenii]
MDDRDLPEGVIDADPPGGWESGAAADGETAEQSRAAQGSSRLSDAGLPGESSGGTSPDAPIESDEPSQAADPDLSNDEES